MDGKKVKNIKCYNAFEYVQFQNKMLVYDCLNYEKTFNIKIAIRKVWKPADIPILTWKWYSNGFASIPLLAFWDVWTWDM